jgi:hypothetical protein
MKIKKITEKLIALIPWNVLGGLLLAFIFVSILSSCAMDDEDQISSPKASPPQGNQGLSSNAVPFAADVKALPEPNKYQVALRWEASANPALWVIHSQQGENNQTSRSEVLDGSLRTTIDNEVQPGKDYTYYLGSMNDPKGVQLGKVKVSIPVDLEILGSYTPNSPLNLGRLFLRPKAQIQTLGTDLVVQAQEIISEGATIQTFPNASTAAPGMNGRSGGQISLRAQKASGRLTLVGDGEIGGPGTDGRNGQDGQIGFRGAPGDWGMNPVLYRFLNRGFVDAFGNTMRRYPKPYTDLEWSRTLGGIPYYICAIFPTGGGIGFDGLPGEDGGRGGNGGDTAAISVLVQTESDFIVDLSAHPGDGGIGGRGGNGGHGGPGGLPGMLDQGHRCLEARTGYRGQDARAGRPGKYGTDGIAKPFCVKIGSKVTGNCETKE